MTVPFFGNWRFEGDFQTSYDPRNRGPDKFWRDRKTFYLVNFLHRWGDSRAYAFTGAGAGFQDRSTEWRHDDADEGYELDPRTNPTRSRFVTACSVDAVAIGNSSGSRLAAGSPSTRASTPHSACGSRSTSSGRTEGPGPA